MMMMMKMKEGKEEGRKAGHKIGNDEWRNLHRWLCRTIPHNIPGFFDGNLGTVCVSNESAASTSSIPF